jgi:hypothetical protein
MMDYIQKPKHVAEVENKHAIYAGLLLFSQKVYSGQGDLSRTSRFSRISNYSNCNPC